ncbi:MAG: KGK domain-containing protein [Halothece sp. Uz-M2-17]|nr:KGK domain-containing protein [Halothece sp. Uz-M2-17]
MTDNNNFLDDKDVVSFSYLNIEGKPFELDQTMKVEEVLQQMSEWVKSRCDSDVQEIHSSFFDIGIECEALKQNDQGWKKGKLRFRIEFIPDETNLEEETEINENQSLDEFRR